MSTTYQPRKSLFRRIKDRVKGWFSAERDPEPVSQPAFAPVSYRPGERDPIVALSRGDVYEFRVVVDSEWVGDRVPYDALVRQAGKYQTSADDTYRRRVWQIARGFGPNQAIEAESAIQRSLGTICYDTEDGQIRCTSYFKVTPDARIREHLTPYLLRGVDAEAEAVLARQRVELVRELVDTWSRLLTELGVSPVKLSAATLTDAGFATVLGRLADRRRQSAKELVDVLIQAAKDHGQLGMYEFAETYASTIAAFQQQMEVEDSEFIRTVMNIEPQEQPR